MAFHLIEEMPTQREEEGASGPLSLAGGCMVICDPQSNPQA